MISLCRELVYVDLYGLAEKNKTEKSFSPIVAQWKLQELQISFSPNQPSTDPQCSEQTGSYAMATAAAVL